MKAWKEQKIVNALARMKKEGLELEEVNTECGHYKYSTISFWPTTGTWWDEAKGKKGHGIDSFIAEIHKRFL